MKQKRELAAQARRDNQTATEQPEQRGLRELPEGLLKIEREWIPSEPSVQKKEK